MERLCHMHIFRIPVYKLHLSLRNVSHWIQWCFANLGVQVNELEVGKLH